MHVSVAFASLFVIKQVPNVMMVASLGSDVFNTRRADGRIGIISCSASSMAAVIKRSLNNEKHRICTRHKKTG